MRGPAGPATTSIATVKKPVGCSISNVREPNPESPVISAAIDPGSAHAVATLTAPNTPMALCTTCGMKLRVEIAPPFWGGDTAVDLPHIRRAHGREQHAIAQLGFDRQIVGEEERPLRCSATHQRARDRCLIHRYLASIFVLRD